MGVKNLFEDLYHIKDILVVILTPIILIPFIVVGDSSEAKCAYCVIIMAVYWITEALPISVTALIPVFLFPMVGVLSVKETSQQYMNSTNMLFVGGLIVAAAIEHWNIHKRIALRILLLVGPEPRWIMFGLMAPTWFLSMWISNTATTAMMVPIANAILLQLKDTDKWFKTVNENEALELNEIDKTEKPPVENEHADANSGAAYTNENKEDKSKTEPDACTEDDKEQLKINFDDIPDNILEEKDDPSFRRLCTCLTLSIAYSANVGGIGSLTGTAPNLVMKGQLDKLYEHCGIHESPITFASWMAFGVPLSFSLVILIWIWLQILFIRGNTSSKGTNTDRNIRVNAVILAEYEKLGPVSFGQAAMIGHFVALAILWITRDIGGSFGWGSLFMKGYVNDAVPAIFIASMLFIFPSNLPEIFCRRLDGNGQAFKPLMSWKDAVLKVPWGVVFLLGGGFAMAYASQESGLSAWVGEKLSVFENLSPWILNLVLCYIVAAMTEMTSNTATCTLMMPILANLAIHLNQRPIYLMFPTAIATSFAFMLPVATPPNAIVFSYGYVRVIDMVIAGFLLNIICVLVLIGFSESLGNLLFHFHDVPEILSTCNITAT